MQALTIIQALKTIQTPVPHDHALLTAHSIKDINQSRSCLTAHSALPEHRIAKIASSLEFLHTETLALSEIGSVSW